jgi:quercetin dioxygenase-like cupin family protein
MVMAGAFRVAVDRAALEGVELESVFGSSPPMEDTHMTRSNRAKITGLVLCVTMPLLAWGQDLPAGAVMLRPSELQWKPLPAPVGAQTSELVGGRTQPGFYVERVQFPANFIHYPYAHPDNRTYAVISGTMYVGFGDTFDQAKLKALPPGSFWTEPAHVNHFLMTKDEPVFFQITGTGPSGTTFVDPAHDPRKK